MKNIMTSVKEGAFKDHHDFKSKQNSIAMMMIMRMMMMMMMIAINNNNNSNNNNNNNNNNIIIIIIIIINMIKLSLDFHVIKEHTYLFLKNSFGYMNYV